MASPLDNILKEQIRKNDANISNVLNNGLSAIENIIPDPLKPSPLDIENIRKKSIAQIKSDINKIPEIDLPVIKKATPGSLKPQGSAKLSGTITALGQKIIIKLKPIIIDMVKQFIIGIVDNEITKAKEKATVEQQIIQNEINTFAGLDGADVQIKVNILKAKKEAISTATKAIETNLRSQLIKFGSLTPDELSTNFESISFDKIPKNFGSFSLNEIPTQIPKILESVKTSVSTSTKTIEDNIQSQLTKFGSTPLNELPKQISSTLETTIKDNLNKALNLGSSQLNNLPIVSKIITESITISAKTVEDNLRSKLESFGSTTLNELPEQKPLIKQIIKDSVPIAKQAIENNLRSQLVNYLGPLSFNELPRQIPLIFEAVFADGCPNLNNPIIQKTIITRNGLVTSLNLIGKQLDTLTKVLTGLNSFLDLSQRAINAFQTAKISVSLAVKAIPSPPGVPGAVTSTLSDLDTITNRLLFQKDGTPRLPKIKGSVASATVAVSIINGYIKTTIAIIEAIDVKLKQCAPNLIPSSNPASSPLISISPNLISIAILQTESEQTQNGVTYAGFLIEIEEVPYTPTVNRRRAVGKNQSGITLIQTELSFTTQDEILINELKLIIDRDNLKAY